MLKRFLSNRNFSPDGAGGGGGGDMVDDLMADLNAGEKAGALGSTPPDAPTAPDPAAAPAAKPAEVKPAPAAAPAKPAEKPPEKKADPAPAKPAAAAPAKPAAPAAAAPAAEKPIDWKTAPAAFRTAHEKLLQVHEETKRELTTKLTAVEARAGELEKRRFLTPEQEAELTALNTRAQQLEAQLYARDYRQSPEFKSKYQDRATKIFGKLKDELASIKIADGDNQRDATMADFAKVRAETTVAGQRRIAKAIFGEDAEVVIKYATDLQTIEDAANEEITTREANFATDRTKSQQALQEETRNSQRAFTSYDAAITTKFPGKLGPVEGDDEFNNALQKGLDYIDRISSTFASQKPEERANNTALTRRLAAAFFPAHVRIEKQAKQIAELEAALAKFNGSDPGAGGEGGGGGGGGGTETGSGTDDLAAEIEKLGV